MLDAEAWVALAFAAFLAALAYLGAHRALIGRIDQHRDRIKTELDEALRLKEEARSLLSECRRRQQDAEQEAAEIVVRAHAEAERMMTEAEAKMQDFIARHTKMAETAIARAEAQARAEVAAAAADAAVGRAEETLRRSVRGDVAENLLSRGVEEVKRKLS
jgi:F-type H+-transporting ATPase subunit b